MAVYGVMYIFHHRIHIHIRCQILILARIRLEESVVGYLKDVEKTKEVNYDVTF